MIPRHVPALALGTLALGVAEFSMMSILLPVADDLGVTVPEAGHFISAYAAGVCAGVLIMAAAARKMPLKTLLLIIVGIITLGNTLTVFVGSYHLMLLSRFIAGLPHGAYFGAAGVLCTQLAEPGKASRDMCLMVAGMTIANLAGVPLASFLAWAVSWRAAFAIAAAAALITFSAIRITVPKVPALPDSGFAAQFRFLRSLEPWLVLGAIGLGNGGFFAYYSYVNPVMEHVAAVPASMMSVVITLAGAGMVLGNLFCAKISSSFSDESLAAAGQGVLLLSLASVFFLAHWSPAAIALTTLAAGCVFFISGPATPKKASCLPHHSLRYPSTPATPSVRGSAVCPSMRAKLQIGRLCRDFFWHSRVLVFFLSTGLFTECAKRNTPLAASLHFKIRSSQKCLSEGLLRRLLPANP